VLLFVVLGIVLIDVGYITASAGPRSRSRRARRWQGLRTASSHGYPSTSFP